MQKDEPNQRGCIYRLKTKVKNSKGTKSKKKKRDVSNETLLEKYFQIRVKTTEFMQKQAVAIYFYNFTSQFDAFDKSFKENSSNFRVQSMASSILHQLNQTSLLLGDLSQAITAPKL